MQQQQQDHAQEQCMMLLNMIHQENVAEHKATLMTMWQEMLKRIHANREETSQLQRSLMDAFHKFGVDLASPGLELKEVF